VALFIGRFQPFHKGHLAALKYISARSARVLVVIGSAQEKGTAQNPFSARERLAFVRAALAEAHLSRKCKPYLLPDIPNDYEWTMYLDARIPHYDICYSNNARVLKLMRRAGKEVARVPLVQRSRYSATKIRERMRAKKEWRSRVPPSVAKALAKEGA
jgi:nicotinamide-nucleotide adenylyltransferase